MNQKLIEFFKKQIGRIEVIMTQDNRNFNIDQYHELRVEIKKIKFILNILDESGIRFQNKKHIKTLMRVFKQAGKIRELNLLNLHFKSFKTIKKTKEFQLEINKALKKEKQIFFNMKVLPINYRKIKNLVSKKIKKIESIEDYVKRLKGNINQDINNWKKYNLNQRNKKSITVSKLHDARIHLKYWINYLKIYKINLPENKLVAFEDLAYKLGEWHDFIEFKKHLNRFLQNPLIINGSIVDVVLIGLNNQQKIELLEMEINKKIKLMEFD